MPVVVLSAVFCCVLWGSASPAIKIAYEQFRIDASDTASRLMLSGAMLCAAMFYAISGCYLNLIYMGFISAGAYTLWEVSFH